MSGGFDDEGDVLKGAHHDANDMTGNAITEDERRTLHVAEAAFDTKGRLTPLAGTLGKFALFKWPPAPGSGRISAQWGLAFPAVIADPDVPSASALKLNDWTTVDTTLDTITVGVPTGASIAAGTVGIVVRGSDLSAYQAMFFPLGAGGGGSISPAKIASVISPTVYQVDLYDNDFSSSPTATALTAEQIDLNSVTWAVTDQVVVFKDGTKYYIASSRPWTPNTSPPVFDGRVTAALGGGSYSVRQTTGPFPTDTVFGPTLTAKNYGGSTLVDVGMDVPILTVGTEFRIWCPLGDCS